MYLIDENEVAVRLAILREWRDARARGIDTKDFVLHHLAELDEVIVVRAVARLRKWQAWATMRTVLWRRAEVERLANLILQREQASDRHCANEARG